MNTPSTRSTETEAPNVEAAAQAALEASMLRHRAESLRTQADHLDDILAVTYRRRASELEMEAWLVEAHAGLMDGDVHSAA